MNSRDSYHHGDLRAALVAEALNQLEALGLEGLSLRSLARGVGVSPNAPYRHFADKDALMATVAAEGFRTFAEALEAVAPGPAIPRLRSLARAYLDFALAHPALYRLMFSPYGYSLHSEPCRLASARSFGLLIETVARAQAEGWKPGQALTPVALGLWSALHGWALIAVDRLVPAEVPACDLDAWLDAVGLGG